MSILYISVIASWACIVIAYGCIYGLFPGMKYRYKIPQIQLILSIMSLALGGYYTIYSLTHGDYLRRMDSLFSPDGIFLFLFFPLMMFGLSCYKYRNDKKQPTEITPEVFELKKEEYKLHAHLDSIGPAQKINNIISYAVFDRGVIQFISAKPTTEIDATFACYKVEDGVYQCLFFEDHSIGFKRMIRSLSSWILFLGFLMIPIIMIQSDFLHTSGMNSRLFFEQWFTADILLIFGLGITKVFSGEKGCVFRIFRWLGVFCIIGALVYAIDPPDESTEENRSNISSEATVTSPSTFL